MQEHIRRAHPEYYIPKLPATKESFELMITSPPHERPPQDTHGNPVQLPQTHHPQHHHHHSDPSGLSPAFNLDPSSVAGLSSFEGYPHVGLGSHDGGYYTAGDAEAAAIYHSMQQAQRSSDEYRRGSLIPAASAAAALAQLHYHRPDSADWGGGGGADGNLAQVITFPSIQVSPTLTEADFLQNFYADQNHEMKNHFHVDPALEDHSFMPDHANNVGGMGGDPTSYPASTSQDLMPNSLAHSPADRPNTLPSLQRSLSRQHSSGRPRKSSLLGQQARLGKHERRKSKELKRSSGDRKAFSAEPSAAALYGKRWEDLIDAATSATEEEGSRDLTPVRTALLPP